VPPELLEEAGHPPAPEPDPEEAARAALVVQATFRGHKTRMQVRPGRGCGKGWGKGGGASRQAYELTSCACMRACCVLARVHLQIGMQAVRKLPKVPTAMARLSMRACQGTCMGGTRRRHARLLTQWLALRSCRRQHERFFARLAGL